MDRLDKRLAGTGKWSRKEARELIRSGRVRVGGEVCRCAEEKVPAEAVVEVDGAAVDGAGPVYIMMHKPAGLVSATEDPREETVLSLLPPEYQKRGLFPVGRLDKDTEGLLLLTDDGPLAHRLLAPKSHVDKVYYVEVDGVLDGQDVEAVREGMVLADGLHCLPAELEIGGPDGRNGWITLREGKYHQVKRMLASRGKPVTYLKRVRFGPLQLDPALPKGGWRSLNSEEIIRLFRQ